MISIPRLTKIAKDIHGNQTRSNGKNYFDEHVLNVLKNSLLILEELKEEQKELIYCGNFIYELSITALFHDTIEDHPTSYNVVKDTIGEYMVNIVDLTRLDGESYFTYVMRLAQLNVSTAVLIVKLADLRHNMSDLKEGSLKDKYRFAEYIIKSEINSRLK